MLVCSTTTADWPLEWLESLESLGRPLAALEPQRHQWRDEFAAHVLHELDAKTRARTQWARGGQLASGSLLASCCSPRPKELGRSVAVAVVVASVALGSCQRSGRFWWRCIMSLSGGGGQLSQRSSSPTLPRHETGERRSTGIQRSCQAGSLMPRDIRPIGLAASPSSRQGQLRDQLAPN